MPDRQTGRQAVAPGTAGEQKRSQAGGKSPPTHTHTVLFPAASCRPPLAPQRHFCSADSPRCVDGGGAAGSTQLLPPARDSGACPKSLSSRHTSEDGGEKSRAAAETREGTGHHAGWDPKAHSLWGGPGPPGGGSGSRQPPVLQLHGGGGLSLWGYEVWHWTW